MYNHSNKGVSRAGIAIAATHMKVNDVVKATMLSHDDVNNLMSCVHVREAAVFHGWKLLKQNGPFPLCRCEWTRRWTSLRKRQEELLEALDFVASQPWSFLKMPSSEVLETLHALKYVVSDHLMGNDLKDAVRVWVVFSKFGPDPQGVSARIAREWNGNMH